MKEIIRFNLKKSLLRGLKKKLCIVGKKEGGHSENGENQELGKKKHSYGEEKNNK